MADDVLPFRLADAARVIRSPRPDDDKYRRGVLGVITGSEQYPGAAVLGVEAAVRTGVGMVRYLGPELPTRLVLQRRPEAVPGPGRVQAWVIGSGVDPADADPERLAHLDQALASGVPLVLDSGALHRHSDARRALILTPHEGELARLLDIPRAEVAADRVGVARRAAAETGAVVLLKGQETLVAEPDGAVRRTEAATPWLATAGSGDALAGIIGALLAGATALAEETGGAGAQPSTAQLVDVALAGSVIHAVAGDRASVGGPLTVLDLCREVSPVIAALLTEGLALRG